MFGHMCAWDTLAKAKNLRHSRSCHGSKDESVDQPEQETATSEAYKKRMALCTDMQRQYGSMQERMYVPTGRSGQFAGVHAACLSYVCMPVYVRYVRM